MRFLIFLMILRNQSNCLVNQLYYDQNRESNNYGAPGRICRTLISGAAFCVKSLLRVNIASYGSTRVQTAESQTKLKIMGALTQNSNENCYPHKSLLHRIFVMNFNHQNINHSISLCHTVNISLLLKYKVILSLSDYSITVSLDND